MKTKQIAGQNIVVHNYNTVIMGAGAAGMNCAAQLYKFMEQKGVKNPQERIVVVTAGLGLGASRMSGSDKQTYYKMGASPDIPDSAEDFAKSLTVAGCCHGDLALAEAIGSLRGFYHLVDIGVPFPHDAMGTYIGYKTDHDPYERATSAGPKTSRFMSECLEKEVRHFGVSIHDKQEAAELLTIGEGKDKRIIGLVTIDKNKLGSFPAQSGFRHDSYDEKVLTEDSLAGKTPHLTGKGLNYAINVYCAKNIVLAAGGPGELYETSVYPKGQLGIHGIALKAGLTAENLTESQFGLASTKFRWNVSGTYMQVIPRIFSTDADGNDEKDFLTHFFPTMSKMATNIFLKGYQWPFDPQRIENLQSSLIDVIVFNETQKGRRVFMDFLKNPVGNERMKQFNINDLEPEALIYLQSSGALHLQELPIERLEHMNPLAIKIYKENGIDLYNEPLEIAVCAQHNNGGFSVNKWWESSIPGTFVIGEMAGTHGVKRPGGSALNAGQVGAQRAAEYIVNVYGAELPELREIKIENQIQKQITDLIKDLDFFHENTDSQIADHVPVDTNNANVNTNTNSNRNINFILSPQEIIKQIQHRMTVSGGHIRELKDARNALGQAIGLYKTIKKSGFSIKSTPKTTKNNLEENCRKNIQKDLPRNLEHIITAIQVEHLALCSVAYLKAIVDLLSNGSGSRGSHLALSEDGIEVHPDVIDRKTNKPLKFKPENKKLQNSILRIQYDRSSPDMFSAETISVRPMPKDRKAFEPVWQDYRQGEIYKS